MCFILIAQVQVLGKLHHPHLVTLLGACSESWSLVYEYLPNGSLQDQLFHKSNSYPLPWKDRVRIIAEISSALCYLHSSRPEKIVHGALKTENILLDSKLRCKICDFGISRLVTGGTLRSPSFRQVAEPKNAFPYTDPEFYRTGKLTPKSDVYAFGLIVLQLLTGRPPLGLLSDVRRAVSSGKMDNIVDSSAGEWSMMVVKRLVELSLQCCELQARNRPDVTPTLVKELEQLHALEERPVPSFFLCPILRVSSLLELVRPFLAIIDGLRFRRKLSRFQFSIPSYRRRRKPLRTFSCHFEFSGDHHKTVFLDDVFLISTEFRTRK